MQKAKRAPRRPRTIKGATFATFRAGPPLIARAAFPSRRRRVAAANLPRLRRVAGARAARKWRVPDASLARTCGVPGAFAAKPCETVNFVNFATARSRK